MKLSNQNIDKTVEDIQKFFEKVGVAKKDILKLCLILEESLIQYQEKFGEDREFSIRMKKWFSTPKIIVSLKGEPFNPLKNDDEKTIFSASAMENLLNYETAGTAYKYEYGCNEIRLFSTIERKPLKIPGGSITIATLSAIIFSMIMQNFSSEVQNFFVETLVKPISNTLMGLIVAITLPTIFISIVSSICVMEDLATLNSLGIKVIARFILLMFLFAVMAIGISAVFFPVLSIDGYKDSFDFAIILNLFLSAVPKNIITPFAEGNVLQVVILAFLIGAAVVSLSERVINLKKFINESKFMVSKIMDMVLKIIPATIFLCIFQTIMTGDFAEIGNTWKIIAAIYLEFILMSVIMLARIAIKYGVNIKDFLTKLYPVLMISFTTGSSTASMGDNLEICKRDFKIDKNFCDFWIPLSHTLFSGTVVVSLITSGFYAVEFLGETISITQLIILIFLAIQFSIVAIKVQGGMVATLGLLFTQLGVNVDAIGPIMASNIFIVNISGVFGMIVRDCELIDISHKMNFIEQENKNG